MINQTNPIKNISVYELSEILNGLVFDRTQSDVDYAVYCMRNCVHTDENLKGAYNISDKNRVAEAVKYINECSRYNGKYEARVKIRDGWNMTDIIKPEDNEEVLTALKYLKSFLPEAATPEIPDSLDNLTYAAANAVERILYELCGLYERYLDTWLYSGEAYASGFDPHNWKGWDN